MKFLVPTSMKAGDAIRFLFPDSSRRTLQTWLRAGRFFIDGKPLSREDVLLTEGQLLTAKTVCLPPKIPGISILYEDRYLLAIDKPEGLLSVPLDEERSHRHALGLLRRYLETDQIYAVHRLDRETSGILLFARGKESEERLKKLFEKHALKRQYFAIVEGRVELERGVWRAPLEELPSYEVISSPEGKTAITHFVVERRSAKYSYLRLELETGRKHQIRVHCQLAGHPIVGDFRYGATENPMKRLALHSRYLELIHPFTGKSLQIESSLPRTFKVLGA